MPGKHTRVADRYGTGGGGGASLPSDLASRFGASLGTDLGAVRVHTDAPAATAAAGLGAHAFALGDDIVFGAGAYAPGTPSGDWVLAHEVAHTVQQRGGAAAPAFLRDGDADGDVHVEDAADAEADADRAADAMIAGRPAAVHAAPRAPARIPEAWMRREPPITEATLGRLDSERWRVEPPLLTETVRIPGTDGTPVEVTGQFTRSRFYQGGRASAMPRAGGELALDPNVIGDDVGAMPRFIESHPALARLWGMRLEHNADGLTTHVVLPTPETFRRLRAAIGAGDAADLAPRSAVRAADYQIDGPEFAQSLRLGAPPVSVANGRLYHHDWLQHMPGFLTLGRHTRAFLETVGAMVTDVQRIAALHGAREGASPALQLALSHAADGIATNGTLIEAQVTYIGEQMAARTAQLDRAELTRRYTMVWGDEALNNEPTSTDRAGLPAEQQARFDAAITEMRARQARGRADTAAARAARDRAIAEDLEEGVRMMQRADALAAEQSVTVQGRTLSLLDERRLEIDLEQLASEGRLDAALAEIRQQHTALRDQVQRALGQRRAVQQYGADASGAAVPSTTDRDDARRLEALDALVPRIEALAAGTGAGARDAFVHHFEEVGLRMVGGLLDRASSRVTERAEDPGRAHFLNLPPTRRAAEDQLDAAQLAAARAALGTGFIWTDPQVFAAVSAAVELSAHPVRARWIREEHARRQPPPESHTLRNVVLGSLVALSLVTGTVLLVEAMEGAGAAAAVFTTEAGAATAATTATSTAATVTSTAATVQRVRIVLDGIRVAATLEELAVESGAVRAVVTAGARAVGAPF